MNQLSALTPALALIGVFGLIHFGSYKMVSQSL